ncbi:unnamed protein product [Rhizoctonia solani]|uniref:DJ-1/PfpI domain-containing protein n=1 Tax=Rhizoctonia solani TaxID=456999 RepID=A0A8H2XUZ7_9AGAM|nr:unnamed protein product [Rhizoctonia solani]
MVALRFSSGTLLALPLVLSISVFSAPNPDPSSHNLGLDHHVPRNTTARTTWKFGVVLFPKLVTLDFQGPMELLGLLAKGSMTQTNPAWPYSPYEFEIDYLAESLDPVIPGVGPTIIPTKTFSQVNSTQYDIILVPGGMGTRPAILSPKVLDFVKKQTPGLQYLLSVCTGAWVLANAGVLEGKNATTNKAAFAQIRNETSKNINWVPKARWVVDGNTWTSSGVTAGIDMANAFIIYLVGPEYATKARNVVELRAAEQGDDPFAEIYGLV